MQEFCLKQIFRAKKPQNQTRYFLGQLALEMGDQSGACHYWDTLDIESIDNEGRLRRIGTVAKKTGNLSWHSKQQNTL